MAYLLLIVGLLILVGGAELLVRGAASLALRVGVSSLVVGLTVVAFGTSTPELAVSLRAGLIGDPDLALGNVVGSNIFNVLAILGLSALVAPLAVDRALIRVQVPVMILASVALLGMAWNGEVSPVEGGLLVVAVVVWVVGLILAPRTSETPPDTTSATGTEGAEDPAVRSKGERKVAVDLFLVMAGLALLVLGARWFVTGARELALAMGVSDLVVGLTVVAAGTSLPELATSVVAALRGQRDIAVGNVVGSNIFNILAIIGLTSVVTPGGLPAPATALAFDLPVMLGVAVVALPVFITGREVSRLEGGLFLLAYVGYVGWLLQGAVA